MMFDPFDYSCCASHGEEKHVKFLYLSIKHGDFSSTNILTEPCLITEEYLCLSLITQMSHDKSQQQSREINTQEVKDYHNNRHQFGMIKIPYWLMST